MTKRLQRLGIAGSFAFLSLWNPPASYQADAVTMNGDLPASVSYCTDGNIQYVVGRIVIHEPAVKVWPILANPFEFEQTISPKFKTVQVVYDKPDLSILKCQVDVGFLFPVIKYTVESKYDRSRTIRFHSIAGDLRDFRGTWTVTPTSCGDSCEVAYSIHVVPGIPVPQWLVRQAVKAELPQTLAALRNRVEEICSGAAAPVTRTIAAARRLYQ